MLATVCVVVATHNLAFGVLTGVLIASLNFATKVARFMVVTSVLKNGVRNYTVIGQVFFASSDRFASQFDFCEAVEHVVIDVTHAHFWDITSVSALDRIVIKFRREGAEVEIRGMNDATRTLIDRFGVHDKPEEVEKLMRGH
jgi:SulP family sulfate permease